MTEQGPTRRRAIAILATVAGASLAGCKRGSDVLHEWRGTALGADAYLALSGTSRAAADDAVGLVLDEVERLEGIFSLYRADSEIVRLNRDGKIPAPSIELQDLLHQCRHVHAITDGLFEPTVQAVWADLATRFGTARYEIEARRGLIGLSRVHVAADEIRLEPGMALTLNGIAQGYITDRVAGLLRSRGWNNILIDLGEVRSLGRHPSGRPFRIDVAESALRLDLNNAAAATSSPDALWLSEADGIGHILDPRAPTRPIPWRSVTVVHPSATMADGISTALAIADRTTVERVVKRVPETRVWAVARDGGRLSSPSST